ncbi:uncharacterized protein [Anabrus simplex]|uniref:uncharacterized protein isoform X1 n=1 Tax=Anabrus simplex TaxID=316456 RepID=UPI0035A35FD6
MGTKADFVPEYRNASHPWLVEAPEWHHLDWRTTNQATYTVPKSGNGHSKGKRRELLEQFFWEQMANEVLQDFSEPHPIEKYSSEYDGSFNIPDYKPALDAFETDSDLHRKYPLYTDGGLSYWQQKCGRTGRGPFKRNSFFSKPMSEVLDEPPEGL